MSLKAFPVRFGLKRDRCPKCRTSLVRAELSRIGQTVSLVCPKAACGREQEVFWLGGKARGAGRRVAY